MKAKVISVDKINKTGMFHLSEDWSDNGEENAQTFKTSLLGKIIEVKKAHYANDKPVYYSKEVKEYFSSTELEIQ